jgi:8-oxo-dGTP diphosphatase
MLPIAVAVILESVDLRAGRSPRVLVLHRAAERVRGGVWEFPGGKVEAGEEIAAAAVREAREEVGLEIETFAALAVSEDHDAALPREQSVRLHAVLARPRPSCEPTGGEGRPWQWVTLDELDRLPTHRGNAAIHAALRGWLEAHRSVDGEGGGGGIGIGAGCVDHSGDGAVLAGDRRPCSG